MVSHTCLRVAETTEALLSLHPFNHATETMGCPGKLDQVADLCLKTDIYIFFFPLAGWV